MYQKLLSAVVLLICTYTDLRSRRINRSLLFLYMLLVCAGHISEGIRICCSQAEYYDETRKLVEIISQGITDGIRQAVQGMIPGSICLVLSFLTRQALGYGDSILIIISGAALGTEVMYSMLVTAFFWSGIWAFIVWRLKKKNRSEELPFVPFLFAGFLIQNMGRI